jgi:predicted transcriptional regulator
MRTKKITPEQIEAIINDERKQKIIAKEYGISQAYISYIKITKNKKNLMDENKYKKLEQQIASITEIITELYKILKDMRK